ncbi:MAG: transposase [Gammaproteobacteria bacterium]
MPVKVIELSAPDLDGPNAADYEVITHKNTLPCDLPPRDVRGVERRSPGRQTSKHTATVDRTRPEGLGDGSMADVSLIVSVLLDKFLYHLPLYRQHQRLCANGIGLCSATLTNWVQRSFALLGLIYQAQLRNILLSKVLVMDEAPIKARRNGKGPMKGPWF